MSAADAAPWRYCHTLLFCYSLHCNRFRGLRYRSRGNHESPCLPTSYRNSTPLLSNYAAPQYDSTVTKFRRSAPLPPPHTTVPRTPRSTTRAPVSGARFRVLPVSVHCALGTTERPDPLHRQPRVHIRPPPDTPPRTHPRRAAKSTHSTKGVIVPSMALTYQPHG